MTSSLEISGKKMHSIKYASEHSGYSRDYITKLAREEKIVASQIGRNWFVDTISLEKYASVMEDEQKLRQHQLSEERKRELQHKEAVERKPQEQVPQRSRIALRSKLVAFSVLLLGLGAGTALNRLPPISTEINRQVASAPLVQDLSGKVAAVTDQGAIAVDSTGAEALNFSHEAFRLSTLSESSQGILILPNATTSVPLDTRELFSDDVQILTDENGVEFIARVDATGEIVDKIPFVVVPVSKKDTP